MSEGSGDIDPESANSVPSTRRLEYHVVMRTLTGPSAGVMTRTMFNDRAGFERWYEGTMLDGTKRPLREVYDLVAQGISDSDAADLIASTENTASIIKFLSERKMRLTKQV